MDGITRAGIAGEGDALLDDFNPAARRAEGMRNVSFGRVDFDGCSGSGAGPSARGGKEKSDNDGERSRTGSVAALFRLMEDKELGVSAKSLSLSNVST